MLELNETNYIREVEQAAEPVLIGLWDGWGGTPLSEGFLQLASAPLPGVKCCKLDIRRQPQLAQRLLDGGAPSLLLLQGGRVEQRFRGAYDREALSRILQP